MTSFPVPTGRGGQAAPKPTSELIGLRLVKSPVIEQSDRSLSSKKPAELQDDADQSDPAGRVTVYLHCGGETAGDR